VTVVFGMMADKDLAAGLAELRHLRPAGVVFTAAQSPRAARPEDLAGIWGGGEVALPALAAAERGIELAGPGGLVLVCGSLYVVGEVRPALVGRRR
jgi:dihydrofolate synthase/folylpolyglutamate synthase